MESLLRRWDRCAEVRRAAVESTVTALDEAPGPPGTKEAAMLLRLEEVVTAHHDLNRKVDRLQVLAAVAMVETCAFGIDEARLESLSQEQQRLKDQLQRLAQERQRRCGSAVVVTVVDAVRCMGRYAKEWRLVDVVEPVRDVPALLPSGELFGNWTDSSGSYDVSSLLRGIAELGEERMESRLQKSMEGMEQMMKQQNATMGDLETLMHSQQVILLNIAPTGLPTGLASQSVEKLHSQVSSPHLDKRKSSKLLSPSWSNGNHLETTPASSKAPSIDRLPSEKSPQKKRRSARLSQHESSGETENFVAKHGRKPANVRDLEDVKAAQLRRGSPGLGESFAQPDGRPMQLIHPEPPASAGPSSPTTTVAGLPGEPPLACWEGGKNAPWVNKTKMSTTLSAQNLDLPGIIGKGQGWVSMEKLRQTVDAATVVNKSSNPANFSLSEGQSAFPAEMWVDEQPIAQGLGTVHQRGLVGHLHFGTGLASRIFAWFSCAVLPVALTGLLVVATSVTSGIASTWSVTMGLTVLLFQLGVSIASISFRYNEMDLLVGPSENQLDDYAEERLGSIVAVTLWLI
eukprot:Skav230515  [mRNA]  locus=scaffold4943:57794:74640:+ [translate_table: standard]